MGIFSKLAGALKKTKAALSGAISSLFSRNKLGDEFYEELEEILISSDISVTCAEEIVEDLRAEVKQEKLKEKLKSADNLFSDDLRKQKEKANN